ncbi:MAG: hypothetical protein PHN69_04915 [Candidatus Pacebacteria bacterium]|nr:hypothetical protein [Candidatus Paceibacterota bacterium]
MKISENQLLVLLNILETTLRFADRKDGSIFGYTQKQRLDTYNEIINQQSRKLVELDKDIK